MRYRVQNELDQNPFLKKSHIKLKVVDEQNGYVTIEMVEGQRALREAIKEGMDINTDSGLILSGYCEECFLSDINVLKKSVNYIRQMDGVKEVLLTAAVDTPMDRAAELFAEGVELRKKKQYDQALSKFRIAAEIGYPNAMSALGYMYEEGDGVSQNYDQAVKWYKKAAEMDSPISPMAMNALAWIFATCHDQRFLDGSKAVRWALKATSKEASDMTMDTLAAAYARNGQYNQAVASQRRTIQLLEKDNSINSQKKNERLHEYKQRLQMYKNRNPYTEY